MSDMLVEPAGRKIETTLSRQPPEWMIPVQELGRLTLGPAEDLYDTDGIAIAKVKEPVVVVITTLPTKRRFLHAPDPEEFASGEHQLGSKVTLQFPPPMEPKSSSSWYFTLTNGVSVDFGQIVALSGDFYGVYGNDQEISDQPTQSSQQSQFGKAFSALQNGNASEMRQILAVMQEEIVGFAAAGAAGLQPSDFYREAGTDLDGRYNRITGGGSWLSSLFPSGRYLDMAATNWDHFATPTKANANGARTAYAAGHAVAMQTAAGANGDLTQLNLAYAQEACACHFLTDLFASGHLRTPRRPLYDDYKIGTVGSFGAKIMHDQDNKIGLFVHNNNADSWKAYGDGYMFDTVNRLNYQYMVQSVQASVNEIYAAFQAGSSPATWGAYNLTPNVPLIPESGGVPSNYTGTSPLFIGGYNGSAAWTEMRASDDINNYQWSASRLSYSAWREWLKPGPVYPLSAMPQPTGQITLLASGWGQIVPPNKFGIYWVAGNAVRYGVSFVNAATNEETGICWSPWVTLGYAFPTLGGIPTCPTTGNAIATGRIIYRQFKMTATKKLSLVQIVPWDNTQPCSGYTVVNGVGVTISDNTTEQWQDQWWGPGQLS